MTITFEQAKIIAQKELDSAAPQHKLVLMLDRTRELPFGWVFSYVPSRYLETRNPSDLVPGTGPLVVDHNGTAAFLTSSVPPDVAIAEYLRQWESQRHQ